ncbi:putative ATP-dependent RNA helicase [Trypanosoma theileri]|uniref:RNA helicase n=1 Tax=Trypanosoma theileri TaxID=67003 RepID=A0A1X0P9B9_9TRYP|nr:putative ATP-dependent RNA helicase [Trypanosoma theileri]ORC93537.1 putative ATP-dependent RNA helicase [Trypanosoma theileri]
MKFHPIPALQVDMRAESQIESFLKKERQREGTKEETSFNGRLSSKETFPTIRLLNVPKSTLKRAVLEFYVRGKAVTAIGQSTRAKRAKILCCMHALQLIDHFSLDASETSSTPTPLPLEEEAPTWNSSSTKSMSFSVIRSSSSSTINTTDTPPQPNAYKRWEDYVADSELYVKRQEERERNEAYAQMRIPLTGNMLVDRATRITENERCTNQLALQQLNNQIRGATKEMNVVQVMRRVFVSTLVLDSATHLSAIGVANTPKEAKQRTAMHALNILKLVKEQRQESTRGNTVRTATNFGGSGSCVSSNALSTSLTPRYGKMLDFFTLLCDVTPSSKYTKESNCYTCQMELDGVKCTGRGINRFEAERNAIETALTEMELYDERLQAINSLISRYPNMQPQTIPSVTLPESLRNEIHSFVQQCRKELHLPEETIQTVHTTTTTTTTTTNSEKENENSVPSSSSETVVDVETRATLAALEASPHDAAYSSTLLSRLRALRLDAVYLSQFHPRRSSLPIARAEAQLHSALATQRAVVVCGATGCGKTTQVPQFLLDAATAAGCGGACRVIVTQPRRLSACGVAARIAAERRERIGETVGYAVRLDARPGRHITLCTTGVLLQLLVGSPALETVSHLVIDEVHERDVNCDVLLALVRQILQRGNPRLRVVLMSATMQSEKFAAYFGNVPVINVEGTTYPVKERYLEDIVQLLHKSSMANYYSPMFDVLDNKISQSRRGKNITSNRNSGFRGKTQLLTTPLKTDYGLIARLIELSVSIDLQNEVSGKSILVFLPGWKELIAAKQALENITTNRRYHIILLHSSVDAEKQRQCFEPAPEGYIKVVFATNIAESGITIDDAAVVIDTGLIKQTTWVPRDSGSLCKTHTSSFATHLTLQYASRANCTQRKGRAGRTQGGVCYRLFTREIWDALPSFQEAEIHRVPLTQVLLKLLSLGYTKPKETLGTFIEPPSVRNVEASLHQLQCLGAVTATEELTPLGLYLSRLPCDPPIGKMIMMGVVLRCLDSALTMAATADVSPFLANRELSFEIRQRRHILAMGSQSDHISVLNAYNAFCARRGDVNFARENFLHMGNLRLISRYKEQYREILRRSGFIRSDELNSLDVPGNNNNNDNDDDDGFLVSDDTSSMEQLYVDSGPLSSDASDVTLVKACLCAALFPNVAVLDPAPLLQGSTKTKKLVMRTSTRVSISPSKDSACRRLGPPRSHGVLTAQEFFDQETHDNDENNNNNNSNSISGPFTPSMLYMYQNVFGVRESREEFLTQVSSVSLWALLLFGVGEADMQFDPLLNLCIVGGWIGIKIDSSSFAAMQALRTTLHAVVWRKYKHPDDDKNNKALEVLRGLCKAVLKSPPNDREQYINRLVDTGRIVSPTKMEPFTNISGDNTVDDDIDDDTDDANANGDYHDDNGSPVKGKTEKKRTCFA